MTPKMWGQEMLGQTLVDPLSANKWMTRWKTPTFSVRQAMPGPHRIGLETCPLTAAPIRRRRHRVPPTRLRAVRHQTAAPRAAMTRLGRRPAQEVVVDHGFLRFYGTQDKRFLVAHCGAHADCRLTRTCVGNDRCGREGQWRPIGLLLAWMSKGANYPDAQSHVHDPVMPSYEERCEAREVGKQTPGMQTLADIAGRARRPVEDEEPAVVP